MTIQELYDWAKENDVVNCDLLIRDIYGDLTYYVVPNKVTYTDHYEVELNS